MSREITSRRGGDARSLAEAFAGLPAPRRQDRRTGSRVHANSGTRVGDEGAFWAKVSSRQRGLIMRAAEKYDLVGRLGDRRAKSRRKIGYLGAIAINALRFLLSSLNRKTGELYPSIETIARRTGHSIAAVHVALVRLRKHGFLAWLRRFEPTGNAGLRGPQVRQASNAYRVMIPKALARYVQNAPLPDDDVHRRLQEAEETRLMFASIPLDALPGVLIDDPALAAVLERLGRALMLA